MYSEIQFIFDKSLESTLSITSNNDNKGNIYGRPIKIKPPLSNSSGGAQGQVTNVNAGSTGQDPNTGGQKTAAEAEEGILVYKNPSAYGTVGIRNYLKENVFIDDSLDGDPYISLIKYFDGKKNRSMMLRAADFAYLKDLGVYPINRLWILRRFPDNTIVPNNLLEWGNGVSPISTVVGWIKDREDTPFATVSFNEVWVDQNQMIDKVLTEILNDEFGLKLPMMMSVPGWSQGILFGMLNAMGLTQNFDAYNVPTGDPNVLRTGKMRDINNQGLQSQLGVTLETCYEQKYINGVDPGLAFQDIITNLLKMGTSDQKFILGNSLELQKFLTNINKTGSAQNVEGWVNFILTLVDKFLEGVKTFINDLAGKDRTNNTTVEKGGETKEDQKNKTQNIGTQIPSDQTINKYGEFVSRIGTTLLAGTVSKYKWPLKGSIALMSGINTTPWHLTVGNPYSPIINIGNILVRTNELKLSNDLGFNDMPIRIDVSFSVEFGRPLGKQELEKMFNNGYRRIYSSKSMGSLTDPNAVTSNTSASGEATPYTSDGTLFGRRSSSFDPGLVGTDQNSQIYRQGSEISPTTRTTSRT